MTTPAMRGALHLWLDQVSAILNDRGVDQTVVIAKLTARGVSTRWTGKGMKETVFQTYLRSSGWQEKHRGSGGRRLGHSCPGADKMASAGI